MEIVQIIAVGLAGAICLVFVRQVRPEFAVLLSVAIGIVIFLFLVGKVLVVLNILEDLSLQAQIELGYLDKVLKIIGVAYITEFAAQVCRDAGEGAVAAKVEFGGKVIILVLAVPIILAILEIIVELLP
ncbi:MAG TPA: stage III sporulation protein AD [Firmicutes bacterium]|nr:stage III sporulation protein AD [Bacillota bacterium]